MKTLYLCGPINGRTDADAIDWREHAKALWPGLHHSDVVVQDIKHGVDMARALVGS